jgi:hypothetical protein
MRGGEKAARNMRDKGAVKVLRKLMGTWARVAAMEMLRSSGFQILFEGETNGIC